MLPKVRPLTMTTSTVRPSTDRPPPPSEFDPVAHYAHSVIDGAIVAGPWVRLACKRHLDDLQHGPARGLKWRLDKALRAIRYYETQLHLNGGDFEGRPFLLELWQKFIAGSLFGWYAADGYRRFRSAYLEIGKGNGKSPLVAGAGLYMMTSDGEERAECYAAAAMKDQAMILFRDAVAMVDQSPELASRIKKSGAAGREWNLAYMKTRSFFRPIANDHKGRGKSGLRVHFAALDELHEHQTAAMVDMLAMGIKGRKQPLIVKITNSGVDRKSVCWAEHDYAVRIVRGLAFDDAVFSYVCALDDKDDWMRDEGCWPKANPNLGVSISPDYLRKLVHQATGMPSKQSIVARLNFCKWVDAENPWITGDLWRASVGKVDRAKLAGRKCYGGLDLSGKNAFTAYTRVYPPGDGETKAVALTVFWTPEVGLREREDADMSPYTQWVKEGFLQKTPGGSVDFGFAAKKVADDVEHNGLVELAFDRWRIEDFKKELDNLEVDYIELPLGTNDEEGHALILRPHGQGFQDMGPAVDEIETSIKNATVLVEENPLMNMCSANAVLTSDPAGSRKFDKRKASGRIDGMISLVMAKRCQALAPKLTKSFWE
jgi:phage terminase large subunit-like protein